MGNQPTSNDTPAGVDDTNVNRQDVETPVNNDEPQTPDDTTADPAEGTPWGEEPVPAKGAGDDGEADQPTEEPELTVEDLRAIIREEIENSKPGKDPVHELDTELIRDVRNQLSDLIKTLQAEVKQRPAEGAEITLAMRDLQKGRMWLGVASATARGIDPWGHEAKPDDKPSED